METAIISSIITAIVTLVVCIINSWVTVHNVQEQNKAHVTDVLAQSQQTVAIIELKLSELTKQVEKHNSVIERTYECEKRLSVSEEKISVANHRIDDLEKAVGGSHD